MSDERLPEALSIREAIYNRLQEGLHPSFLEVIDESAKHKGHIGVRKFDTAETHFRVRIQSVVLQAIPLRERHRRIHALLRDLFAAQIHAMSIEVLKS